ncbi:hypothetical protein CCACVL1_22865 [Corchorus capsularis]|uniref:Uncharacterized protein n=1 Tax=Corchorus capsularis TaxID=210143 RepID=A0A1R3GWG3_COCAP|nr:hypothetical protein CCACVL1_22865 [Corchorus capsularis]
MEKGEERSKLKYLFNYPCFGSMRHFLLCIYGTESA